MRFFITKLLKRLTRTIDKFLSFMLLPTTRKFAMLFALIILFSIDALAQSGGAGFSSATTTIQSYKDQVASLMKAIGAVIAIVGAFNVFFKMQNGDQDVKKTIMLTIGGCVAFVALGEALPMFFE